MQISYHSALTKIQKLQNLEKKKKKKSVLTSMPGIGWYCPKLAGMADIFSGTKHGGYMYKFACRYGTESTPLIISQIYLYVLFEKNYRILMSKIHTVSFYMNCRFYHEFN